MAPKTKVYLTSPVFYEIAGHGMISEEKKEKISELWNELREKCDVKVADSRFPSEEGILKDIKEFNANLIGCHLSHPITKEMLEVPSVFAVCTSTAGFNHIYPEPGIIMTHTPGVLHKTVADFTIAIILANLRNLLKLHSFVWNEQWNADQKWDLDENLSLTLENLTLGIVGMGEIGREVTKRIAPWGVKISYFDIQRQPELENQYPNLKFYKNLEDIFKDSDIVSLHVPLLPQTRHLVNKDLLKLMKKNALLVNTARGPIINHEDLLSLLESGEIKLNLAFDVFEEEPIPKAMLKRFKKITEQQPDLKFIFIPHNASADAETRAQMAIMILSDLLSLATSTSLKDITDIHFIPNQRFLMKQDEEAVSKIKEFRIHSFWND